MKTTRKATKRLQATAYHESGHAITAIHLDIPFRYLTIIKNETSLGHVLFGSKVSLLCASLKNEYAEPTCKQKELIERDIIIDFAGFYAEHKFTGRRNKISASQDWNNAISKAEVIHDSLDIIEKYLEYLAVRAEGIVGNTLVQRSL